MRQKSTSLLVVLCLLLAAPSLSAQPDQSQSGKTEFATNLKDIQGDFKQLKQAAHADDGRCLECHEKLNQACEKWGAYELGMSNARQWATRAQQANDAQQLAKARTALGEMLLISLNNKAQTKKAAEAETVYAALIAADPNNLEAHFGRGRALAWLNQPAQARQEFSFYLDHATTHSFSVYPARRFLADPTLAAHRLLAPMLIPLSNGRVVNTQALRGHVLILDFWASWCGPCISSIPANCSLP